MGAERRPLRRLASYERWTDRTVRESMDRGEFDGLSGAGRPLEGLDEPHDDLWWLRRKLADEALEMLPPSLLLRRDVQGLLDRALDAPTEAAARDLVEQANTRIRRANRLGVAGPPHNLSPYDPEVIITRWQERQPPPPPADPQPEAARARTRRWRRRSDAAR